MISLPEKETVSRALDGNPGNAWTRVGAQGTSEGFVTLAGEDRPAYKELRLGVKRWGHPAILL